ncbi:MAG: Lrp/AsnC family transcriptional regulator [Candidatus Woesearchaeota archaeon]
MYKLDLLDRKILYELEIDARQPLTLLAKKLRHNRNVIEFRIKRMQERRIIKNFVTLLDAGKLGLMIWNVYLEFQDLTSEKEKEVIDYLQKNKKVWWTAKTTGKWNLIYSIGVKDVKGFYNTVTEFNSKFGKYILNQSLAAHVEVEIFSRGYFLNKPSTGVTWSKEVIPSNLDETDKNVLRELSTNARISSVELARKLKLSQRIVSYRIKDLIKKQVITKFRPHLDVSKMGYSFYKVILYVKEMNKDKDARLKEYCRQLGNVFHYERKIGPWMLELEMDVESYEKINQLLKKMKEDMSEIIRSYEILMIYEEPKGELDLTQLL